MRALRLCCFCLWALPVWADPTAYAIDSNNSEVTMTFTALGNATRARAPIVSGQFLIDFNAISRSDITVSVDVSRIRAAIPFVAQTLRSPVILDTGPHPEVRFVATDIRLNAPGDFSQGARIAGRLTIKGQTQPVVFQARLTRSAGSDPSDLSQLSVAVSGAVDRRSFGITAFEDTVAPMISLDIDARLIRQ